MKLIAAILLVSFTSFTMEKAIIPSVCMSDRQSCTMKCSRGKCCGAKMMAMKGQHMPAKKGKGSSTPQCTDCPLCVVFIDHPANLSSNNTDLSTSFAVLQVHGLADHASEQWKPPNG